jgi:hypothetical protein
MPTSRYNVNISGGGINITGGKSRTTDAAEGFQPVLPVGKAGTLTTRTSDTAGEATLGAGHGITTGMTVDVYWGSGSRYGVTVGTVAGNVVPISSGTGDVLPAQDTAVVLTPQVQITISLDGDNLSLFGIKAEFADSGSTAKAQVTFHDATDAVIAHLDLNANQVTVIDVEGGDANPFSGNPITYAMASNGSSTAECRLKMVRAQDATP